MNNQRAGDMQTSGSHACENVSTSTSVRPIRNSQRRNLFHTIDVNNEPLGFEYTPFELERLERMSQLSRVINWPTPASVSIDATRENHHYHPYSNASTHQTIQQDRRGETVDTALPTSNNSTPARHELYNTDLSDTESMDSSSSNDNVNEVLSDSNSAFQSFPIHNPLGIRNYRTRGARHILRVESSSDEEDNDTTSVNDVHRRISSYQFPGSEYCGIDHNTGLPMYKRPRLNPSLPHLTLPGHSGTTENADFPILQSYFRNLNPRLPLPGSEVPRLPRMSGRFATGSGLRPVSSNLPPITFINGVPTPIGGSNSCIPSTSSYPSVLPSSNNPNTSGNNPNTSGNIPSTSGNSPSTSGNSPSTSGNSPSTSGNSPSTSGNIPSTSGNTPSTSGIKPSTSGVNQSTLVNINLNPLNSSAEVDLQREKKIDCPAMSDLTNEKTAAQSNNDEEGMTCSICFELWSNSGQHRMSSLKCGHVFGKNCIERWLSSSHKCPTCNAKSTKKDIRIIYARCLKAIDTSERDRIAADLQIFKAKVDSLEREKAKILMKNELDSQKMLKFQRELNILKNSIKDSKIEMPGEELRGSNICIYRLVRQTKLELTKEGSTRVMAYNDWLTMLVISVPTSLAMFPGFGIRQINLLEMRLGKYIPLHSKTIRDLAFNPSRQELLLSVSLDKTAKIFNVATNNLVQSYTTSQPLWCCCWNSENPSEFFVGTAKGAVHAFSTEESNNDSAKSIYTLKNPRPILSIAYVASKENDGFHSGLLITKLNSISFLEFRQDQEPKEHDLPLEGPFVHSSYNCISGHILVTCRMSQNYPNVRHIICMLTTVNISEDPSTIKNIVSAIEVHTLQGGRTMNVLSRTCFSSCPNTDLGTLAIFSEEGSLMSKIYDVKSAKLFQMLKTESNIIDCLPMKVLEETYLALLSEKCVTLYKWMNLQH